ncbi:MAG TPA: thioredoxin domain-containing protein [Chitinophagaceae bacterium]|nr:thioredoxin domain-containing protein [Chitinophagaceae bacterium]
MKKVLTSAICLLTAAFAFSQTNTAASDTFAYTREAIPAFTVYKAPDSTAFTNADVAKKRPVLLMLFSPECGHCQHVAKEILQHLDTDKKGKAKILMFTWLPYSTLVSFRKDYKIADYPQITLGYDSKFFFVPYYHVTTFPKLIVYDKSGKFVRAFEGNIEIEDVWKALGEK